MRLYDRINESEAEAVARRVFALHEPLNRSASYLRWETRTIIFDYQFC
jgi:hypothetical protein